MRWLLPSQCGDEVEQQLWLPLFLDEPWEGRSPRGLTRGRLGLILTQEGEKSTSAFLDPL